MTMARETAYRVYDFTGVHEDKVRLLRIYMSPWLCNNNPLSYFFRKDVIDMLVLIHGDVMYDMLCMGMAGGLIA